MIAHAIKQLGQIMKKEIHPQSQKVNFVCTSCNASFLLDSTIKSEKTTIDVCSNCHPFYIGNLSAQQVRGRSEKLAKKFEAGKNQINSEAKKEKETKKTNKKIIKSLDNL